MRKHREPRKPCRYCGGPKPAGRGRQICSGCVDRQFWTYVNKTDGCWLWTGITRFGYGRFDGRVAHRLAYELITGAIPVGLELDHLCRTPACVNPAHLEPVTREENIRRRYEAQTHCKRDHEFTSENTYVDPRGRRTCIACRRMRVRLASQERAV